MELGRNFLTLPVPPVESRKWERWPTAEEVTRLVRGFGCEFFGWGLRQVLAGENAAGGANDLVGAGFSDQRHNHFSWGL
jgi:hypothetical protein